MIWGRGAARNGCPVRNSSEPAAVVAGGLPVKNLESRICYSHGIARQNGQVHHNKHKLGELD